MDTSLLRLQIRGVRRTETKKRAHNGKFIDEAVLNICTHLVRVVTDRASPKPMDVASGMVSEKALDKAQKSAIAHAVPAIGETLTKLGSMHRSTIKARNHVPNTRKKTKSPHHNQTYYSMFEFIYACSVDDVVEALQNYSSSSNINNRTKMVQRAIAAVKTTFRVNDTPDVMFPSALHYDARRNKKGNTRKPFEAIPLDILPHVLMNLGWTMAKFDWAEMSTSIMCDIRMWIRGNAQDEKQKGYYFLSRTCNNLIKQIQSYSANSEQLVTMRSEIEMLRGTNTSLTREIVSMRQQLESLSDTVMGLVMRANAHDSEILDTRLAKRARVNEDGYEAPVFIYRNEPSSPDQT